MRILLMGRAGYDDVRTAPFRREGRGLGAAFQLRPIIRDVSSWEKSHSLLGASPGACIATARIAVRSLVETPDV